MELTYAALSIHLHCVQNLIVILGSGAETVAVSMASFVVRMILILYRRVLRIQIPNRRKWRRFVKLLGRDEGSQIIDCCLLSDFWRLTVVCSPVPMSWFVTYQ